MKNSCSSTLLTFSFFFLSLKAMLVKSTLVSMYTMSCALLKVSWFCTLMCTNWYEFQFHSHDDAHIIWPNIYLTSGPSVTATMPNPTTHVARMGIHLFFLNLVNDWSQLWKALNFICA